jgi:hypothetical protein
MPRTISHDKTATFTVEITVRYVDGDALLAFRIETICQQRKVQDITGRMLPKTIASQSIDLIIGQHARVVQKPTEQRALTIVNAAARNETQHAAGSEVCSRHQK